MISSKELLNRLKKLDSEEQLLINNNQYTLSQIELAKRIVEDLEHDLLQASTKPKLSRRRSFIVILEELFYNSLEYPKELTLDKIHRYATMRFEYMNRESRGFETPTQIHPKNPCLYYEDNGHGKARYIAALRHLVNDSNKYFQVPEAEASLQIILDDVKLC